MNYGNSIVINRKDDAKQLQGFINNTNLFGYNKGINVITYKDIYCSGTDSSTNEHKAGAKTSKSFDVNYSYNNYGYDINLAAGDYIPGAGRKIILRLENFKINAHGKYTVSFDIDNTDQFNLYVNFNGNHQTNSVIKRSSQKQHVSITFDVVNLSDNNGKPYIDFGLFRNPTDNTRANIAKNAVIHIENLMVNSGSVEANFSKNYLDADNKPLPVITRRRRLFMKDNDTWYGNNEVMYYGDGIHVQNINDKFVYLDIIAPIKATTNAAEPITKFYIPVIPFVKNPNDFNGTVPSDVKNHKAWIDFYRNNGNIIDSLINQNLIKPITNDVNSFVDVLIANVIDAIDINTQNITFTENGEVKGYIKAGGYSVNSDNKYFMWFGGKNPDSAKFSIDVDGNVIGNNIKLSGISSINNNIKIVSADYNNDKKFNINSEGSYMDGASVEPDSGNYYIDKGIRIINIVNDNAYNNRQISIISKNEVTVKLGSNIIVRMGDKVISNIYINNGGKLELKHIKKDGNNEEFIITNTKNVELYDYNNPDYNTININGHSNSLKYKLFIEKVVLDNTVRNPFLKDSETEFILNDGNRDIRCRGTYDENIKAMIVKKEFGSEGVRYYSKNVRTGIGQSTEYLEGIKLLYAGSGAAQYDVYLTINTNELKVFNDILDSLEGGFVKTQYNTGDVDDIGNPSYTFARYINKENGLVENLKNGTLTFKHAHSESNEAIEQKVIVCKLSSNEILSDSGRKEFNNIIIEFNVDYYNGTE